MLFTGCFYGKNYCRIRPSEIIPVLMKGERNMLYIIFAILLLATVGKLIGLAARLAWGVFKILLCFLQGVFTVKTIVE